MTGESAGFSDNPYPVQAIQSAVTDWLQAEIISSMSDNNATLDDLGKFYNDLDLPLHDSGNSILGGKSDSHYSRLEEWTADFANMPDEDYFFDRQIFCVQMYLSGNYRLQCFFQAKYKGDYIVRRRMEGPLGIDIGSVVNQRLQEPAPTIDELTARTHELNQIQAELISFLHGRGKQDTRQEESAAVSVLQNTQQAWLELMVDHIAYGSQTRGGLERIPFLPALSISRHPVDRAEAIYYPFAA